MGSKIRRRSSAALVGEMPVTPRRPRLDHGPTLRSQGSDVVRRVACLGQVQEQPERHRARPQPAFELLARSEEHTSELQSLAYLVCRLLLEKKKNSRGCVSTGR